jgi:diadenosine tetraphosphate (Ap4A) HIT family hydrolase
MKEASWVDPARWGALVDGSGCPICRHGRPRDVIAEFGAVWVTAQREAALPGYACVVSKRHVVEPFHLADEDAARFWAEAMLIARRLAEFTDAVKMNYGVHGNVIPHLHLHLWPRYADDPYDIGGIPADAPCFARADADLHAMAMALQPTAG